MLVPTFTKPTDRGHFWRVGSSSGVNEIATRRPTQKGLVDRDTY